MKIVKKITVIVILLFMASFSASADTLKLNSFGTLHKIEVIPYQDSTAENPKTYLLHTLQKEDGSTEKRKIPLTDDLAPDIEPQLDINPSNQQPSIVWSRYDGSDYEIALSFFDGTRWSSPQYVTSNTNNDRDSRIIIGSSGLIHLMWKEETTDVPIYYHSVISNSDGIVEPTDILIPPEDNLVLPDGTSPPNSSMPDDQNLFFTFHVSLPPNRIVLWGGRDDPSPISFQEGFKLLDANQDLDSLKAEKVNGKLVVIFRSGNDLYYTYRTLEGWTPYRVIKLDESLSEEKGKLLIKEMLNRL